MMLNNTLGVHGLPQGVTNNQGAPNRNQMQMKPKSGIDEKPNHAVNYYGDFGGCGYYRMQMPELLLNYSKKGIITGMHKLIPDEHFYRDVRSVRLQRQASPEHAKFLGHLKNISTKHKLKMIYEVDDIIFKEDIPDFNKAKVAFNTEEVRKATVDMMNMCDVMTVSCDFMKDYYMQHLNHPNIQVVPNMPSRVWFDGLYDKNTVMNRFNKHKNRPRILYAGSGNHFDIENKGRDDDFSHVKDAIINSRKDFKWVFLGSIPMYLHEYVRSGEMEFHDWAMILNYPRKIYDLEINAVVAPLMDCTFNKAKSNIKYLEASCLGIPGVFQDIVTYKNAPLRFTDGRDMINKLNKLFDNKEYYAKLSKTGRNYANQMWLDDHLDIYEDLYFK